MVIGLFSYYFNSKRIKMFAASSCPYSSVTSVTQSVTEYSRYTNSYRAFVTMLQCYNVTPILKKIKIKQKIMRETLYEIIDN